MHAPPPSSFPRLFLSFLADCGYHDGFFTAIAASVFTGVTALLAWFWMPWSAPSASASAGGAPAFSATASTGGSSYANIGEDPGFKVAPAGFNSA